MNQAWTKLLPASVKARLSGSPALQKAIHNTAWLFADNILRMAAGFLVGIFVTRSLGPERFGVLNYAIACVAIFSPVALLGLDGIVVRNLVRDPSRKDETLGTAFVMMLAGGLLSAALALATILLLRPADREVLLFVGIISLGTLFQASLSIDFWFQSQVQSKYSVYPRSIALLGISGAKLVLVHLDAPLIAFVWAGVAEIIIGSVGLALSYRISGSRFTDWRPSRAVAKALFRDSWPLMLTDVVIFISLRVDKIILGEIAGNKELGIYSVAVVLAEALYFIPKAVATTLFPSLVELKDGPEEVFLDRLQQYYNLMAFLGYLVAIPVSMAAVWLVPLLYGQPFARAGTMLVGLVWAGLFMNLTIALGQYLTAQNWTRLHFAQNILGCVANITLNLLLVPRFGGMGAVIASVVSFWLVAHGLCLVYKPLSPSGVMITRALLFPKIW